MEKIKELKAKCERLDILLWSVCGYLVEIMNKDDLTLEHSKEHFNMTQEEYKKYILGEE